MGFPSYTNGTLHGKGRSLNPMPQERFDNSADSMTYNNGAYDSQRWASATNKLDQVKKAIQDENKALGDTGTFQDTVAGSYIQAKAPEWLCSVICANLDLDEITKEASLTETSASTPTPKTASVSFTG
jgi:hypothetical protein